MVEDVFKSWLDKLADKRQEDVDYVWKTSSFLILVKKALLSHSAGKKHSERYIKIKAFFKPANQKKITSNNTEFKSTENSNGSSSSCSSPKTANSFRMGPDKLHY